MKAPEGAERSASMEREAPDRGVQGPFAMTGPRGDGPNLHRILVPIDYSETSKKAVAYAVFLARQFGSEIVLLHVVQPVPFMPESLAVNIELTSSEAREAACSRLAEVRREIPETAAVRMVTREGRPGHEIVRAGEELNCELIVLSTHGRTGVSRVFMGSVAEQVIRSARSPVLVVREHEAEFIGSPASGVAEAGATKPSK